MGQRWLEPNDEPAPPPTTAAERGRILVELLELTDALPPVPRKDLEIPPFKELCGSD